MLSSKPTPLETARNHLVKTRTSEFKDLIISDYQVELPVKIHYFQAMESIIYQVYHTKKMQLTPEEKDNFLSNREHLQNLRKEIIEQSIETILQKYSEAIIIGALVSAIREYEASINHFTIYTSLVEKLHTWAGIGFKSHRVFSSYRTILQSIDELHAWMEDNSNKYIPYIELIVNKDENLSKSDSINYSQLVDQFRLKMPDKEIFYLIANALKTNPLLHEKMDFYW